MENINTLEKLEYYVCKVICLENYVEYTEMMHQNMIEMTENKEQGYTQSEEKFCREIDKRTNEWVHQKLNLSKHSVLRAFYEFKLESFANELLNDTNCQETIESSKTHENQVTEISSSSNVSHKIQCSKDIISESGENVVVKNKDRQIKQHNVMNEDRENNPEINYKEDRNRDKLGSSQIASENVTAGQKCESIQNALENFEVKHENNQIENNNSFQTVKQNFNNHVDHGLENNENVDLNKNNNIVDVTVLDNSKIVGQIANSNEVDNSVHDILLNNENDSTENLKQDEMRNNFEAIAQNKTIKDEVDKLRDRVDKNEKLRENEVDKNEKVEIDKVVKIQTEISNKCLKGEIRSLNLNERINNDKSEVVKEISKRTKNMHKKLTKIPQQKFNSAIDDVEKSNVLIQSLSSKAKIHKTIKKVNNRVNLDIACVVKNVFQAKMWSKRKTKRIVKLNKKAVSEIYDLNEKNAQKKVNADKSSETNYIKVDNVQQKVIKELRRKQGVRKKAFKRRKIKSYHSMSNRNNFEISGKCTKFRSENKYLRRNVFENSVIPKTVYNKNVMISVSVKTSIMMHSFRPLKINSHLMGRVKTKTIIQKCIGQKLSISRIVND